MHRLAVENNLRREYDLENASTTPLRGNFMNLPRRLLVRDFESATSPFFRDHPSLSEILSKSTTGVAPQFTATSAPSTVRDNNHRSGPQGQAVPLNSRVNAVNAGDRFIPRRRGVNFDVSHYYHTHHDANEKDGVYLNVFREIKYATEHWRRNNMDNAFRSLNIFSGIQSRRVLSYGQSPAAIDFKNAKIREFSDDGQWDCRPRDQPHMSIKGENSKRYRDHGAQIFRFAMSIKLKNVIDWSSKNLLAAGLSDAMCLCDIDFKSLDKIYKVEHTAYICCIKWNQQGNQVTVSGVDGNTSMYDSDLGKVVWSLKCPCTEIEERKCKVVGTIWAKKDQNIITACDEGCLNVIDAFHGLVINTENFEKEILAISLSPKEQHLVVSCTDRLVKFFDYPSLVQLFEIAFFSCVKAFAWHPWSSGILCIGGGPGDASLSLWNVNSQKQLGYRKVHFVGSVDYLMFNKLSGELLVHWFYLDNDRLRSKIAVLAGLDRVVDAVPIQPEHRMLNIIWSPDHTKLATQHRDTLVVWNFFGVESNKWSKVKKKREEKDSENRLRNYCFGNHTATGPYTAAANAKRGKNLNYYNIR